MLEGGAPLSSAQLLEEPENVPKRRRTAEEGCGHPGEPRGPQYGHSESRTRATAEAGSEADGPELEHRPAPAWGGRRRAASRRAAEVQLMVTGRSVLTGVLPSCCAGFIRSLQTTVSHRLLHQVLTTFLQPHSQLPCFLFDQEKRHDQKTTSTRLYLILKCLPPRIPPLYQPPLHFPV